MKTVVMAAVVAWGSLAVAQTVVPVDQEPQHRPALENAYIKVLDAAFPPGYVSLFHQHSRDNVSVRITTDIMRLDLLGAEGAPQVAPVGRVSFTPASPPYTHRAVNVGTTTIRIITVELLGSGTVPTERLPDDLVHHSIVFDNERVRATRIQLASGESLPAHAHPRGWLDVVVTGRDPGQINWHPAGSIVPAMISSTPPIEIVEIEPK